MRVEEVDTGGEGQLFVFHLRSGIWLLGGIAACALGCLAWSVVAQDNEFLIVAGALGSAALLIWPLIRWMAWKEVAVALIGSSIRPLKARDPGEPLRTIALRPNEYAEEALGLSFKRRNGGKTQYHRVEYAGQTIASGLNSRYEARQIATVLNQAIAALPASEPPLSEPG